MASTCKPATLLWLSFVLVLIVNAGVMVIPIFIHSPIIQNLIKPFTTAVFMMEAIFFLLGDGIGDYAHSELHNTGGMLCVLFIVVFAILDTLLPGGSQSEEGQDGQANQEQEDHTPEGGKPSLDNMGNFKILTAIFVVVMWITYMCHGMCSFAGLKNDQKYGWKVLINPLFVYIFRFGTLQYVFGMFVNNDAPPLWLYLVYMIPQAVLWPISALLAYYVNQEDRSHMWDCYKFFACFFSGMLMYMGFRMMFQFQQFFKEEGDMKNKIIQGVTIAVGFLWMVFIMGIYSM